MYGSKLTKRLIEIGFYDMTKEAVRKSITEPYMNGEEFFKGGRRIDPHYVEVIEIYETEERVSTIAKKEGYMIDYVLDQIRDHKRGKFVTDVFITSPPSSKKTKKRFGKNVFIVHGREYKPMKELKIMLKEFGLNSIVLHEQPSGSRTIVEKLEKYSDVGYAFVILTPDDRGGYFKGKTPILGGNMLENSHFRARQNVILELGYFIGLLGRDKVCCLYKGDIDLPSDIHGIVYIPFKESVNEVRDKIVKELKAAGYKLKS